MYIYIRTYLYTYSNIYVSLKKKKLLFTKKNAREKRRSSSHIIVTPARVYLYFFHHFKFLIKIKEIFSEHSLSSRYFLLCKHSFYIKHKCRIGQFFVEYQQQQTVVVVCVLNKFIFIKQTQLKRILFARAFSILILL